MFVFPAHDDGYRKRKRAHKACEQCKRRRKRCEPPPLNHERCVPCMKDDIRCSLVTPVPSKDVDDDLENTRAIADRVVQIATAKALVAAAASTTDSKLNIISVLGKPSSPSAAATAAAAMAPVALSTAATLEGPVVSSAVKSSTSPVREPAPTTKSEIIATGFAGDLDPASVLLTLRNVDSGRIGVWVKGATTHQPLSKHLLAYLDSIHAFELPARQDREGLIAIYFKYIHPILPILDRQSFLLQHARDECPTLLLHAVLLTACRHPSAKKFIHLPSARHFASRAATKIRALLHAEIEKDKLTVVRVLALMSLHSEGVDGLEKSSSDLQQAFHYAHFLGLHEGRRSQMDQAQMRRIWWCLWCLDRVSTCVSARPVISRPDDVSVSSLRPDEEGWLGKWYEVCEILDNVIAMYRPLGSKLPLEVDVKVSYGRGEAQSPFASFLQLLRNVACILAHKRAPESPEINASILLRSTSQILNIVRTQSLPPFPAVPYAVSLTLTVYLRLYPSPEARAGWHESCAVLDGLAKTWWVAEAMGGMARSVFRKLEEDLASRQAEEAAPESADVLPGTVTATAEDLFTAVPIVEAVGRSRSPITTGRSSKRRKEKNPVVDKAVTKEDTTLMKPTLEPLTTTGPNSTLAAVSVATPVGGPLVATPSLETQFLEMFSDLPNPTSFLDQALMLDDFSTVPDLWMNDLQFEDVAVTSSKNLSAQGPFDGTKLQKF